jgi:crotonobetainyl-CoA:carnitine CoA-transferase CaiB-like acyl-CoA transferase
MTRLGLGDSVLAHANPKLVRVSLVGYGPGPLRDDAGHDINYQAVAGILALTGDSRGPVVPSVQVGDVSGALYGATAVLAALLERERTGKGRHVEVALADAALAMNAIHLHRAVHDPEAPGRGEGELSGGIPGYRLYRCRDGKFLALGALEPKFWESFVKVVGKPSLAPLHLDRARGAHLEVESLFAERPRDEWLALLHKAGVPATIVAEPREALALHPRFEGAPSPGSPLTHKPGRGEVPGLGEHTEAVLAEAGLSAGEIAQLRASGALPAASKPS